MSESLNEEKILIPETTVAMDICKEAKRIEDTNGTEKNSSEKEANIGAQETKEEKEMQISVKNIQKENPAKDAITEKEEESSNTEKADLKGKDDAEVAENGAKEVQPIIVEEIFEEEKVEPIESLKDISDHLNAAAKSVIQRVAEKFEEKIEKSVEKEERKGVQCLPSQTVTGVEDTFKKEKTNPVESKSDEKVDVSKEEEKVNVSKEVETKPVESNSDEKVDVSKEEETNQVESNSDEKVDNSKEEKTNPVESNSDEKVDVSKEDETKPVESKSDEKDIVSKEEEKVKLVESESDSKVEVTKEEEIKQEVQEVALDSKDDIEKQDDVDGNKKQEIIEPICTQKTVKPLGSPEKEPKPESLPIESSNENNLSGHAIENTLSDATEKPKQEKEQETLLLINEDCKDEQGTNSQISEGETPEEKESFADIAQKIPFADENSDDIIEDVGKAPIVYDDETKVVVENTVEQNEESKEAAEEEDTQLNNNDSECSADIAQEAEAEAEPCTEEIQEPVEAIIDDVEVESVSDNIETGSEQSTTSDTNDTNEKKKNSVNRLLFGAILVALIAFLIAILSLDITSISKAIGITKPEPKPIVKPFWKFF